MGYNRTQGVVGWRIKLPLDPGATYYVATADDTSDSAAGNHHRRQPSARWCEMSGRPDDPLLLVTLPLTWWRVLLLQLVEGAVQDGRPADRRDRAAMQRPDSASQRCRRRRAPGGGGAVTTTPNYGFTLPAIGGDQNVWGGELNGNWMALDGIIRSLVIAAGGTGAGYMPLTGGAINGAISPLPASPP